MADWAAPGGIGDFRAPAAVASTSGGTPVVTGGSAHTKGSWTEIVASTPMNADMVVVVIRGASGADTLTDFAIGAAGSETVIFPNLYAGSGATPSLGHAAIYTIPVGIPAGTRISARSQGHATGQSLKVDLYLMNGGVAFPAAGGAVVTYGANTADSGGVLIDPGASANTKGAYSEITSATSGPLKALIVAFPLVGDGSATAADYLVDVAIGAAGSEVAIIKDFHFASHNVGNAHYPMTTPTFPVAIPSGTRISVRAQCSITGADRDFDAIVYGVS